MKKREKNQLAELLGESFGVYLASQERKVRVTGYCPLLFLEENGNFYTIEDGKQKPFSADEIFCNDKVVKKVPIDSGKATVDTGGYKSVYQITGENQLFCVYPILSISREDGSDGLNPVEIGTEERTIDLRKNPSAEKQTIYDALSGKYQADELGLPVILSFVSGSEIRWARVESRMDAQTEWKFVTVIEFPTPAEGKKIIVLEYRKEGKILRTGIQGKKFALSIVSAEEIVVPDDKVEGSQQLNQTLQEFAREIADIHDLIVRKE